MNTRAFDLRAAGRRAALLVLACLGLPSLAQENYSTWSYHKHVGLNTRPVGGGAAVSGAVLNVPVLVRLDATNFSAGFAQSVGRGADLRFTKLGDAVRLPHQIERWDSAGKKAEIWVRVDSVKGNALTTLRFHWGKAGAADSSNGARVFDTTQGFTAVWHLNESASDSARDASANRFHAAPTASPGSGAAVIGQGRTFDGTSQHFQVPNSAAGKLNFPLDGVYTLSAWAYIDPNSTAVDRVIAAKHDNQYALKISTDARWQFFEYDGNWTIAGASYETGRWTYLTGVMNGRDTYLYVDGLEAESVLDCCAGGGSRNETADFFIGRAGESARRWWWGSIDELRVARVARSADWARLEYQNQRPGATMMLYSDSLPVVAVAPGASAMPERRLGSARAVAEGYAFRLEGLEGAAAQARFEVVGLDGRVFWSRMARAHGGRAETLWRMGQAARGVYSVRMTGLDAEGRAVASETLSLSITR